MSANPYVSDFGGQPNWAQYVHGYDRGNVLQQAGASTWYNNKGELHTGNMLMGDDIPEAYRLDPKYQYKTRWHVGDAQAHPGGGWSFDPSMGRKQTGRYMGKNEAMGAPWGWVGARANAPSSVSHMSQWYEARDPGHRANLTTGKAALARTTNPGGQYGRHGLTSPRGGRHYGSGRFGAREVIDWDAYDRDAQGKEWLKEKGRHGFLTRQDLYDFHEWQELGESGRAKKEAEARLAEWKAAEAAMKELRQAQQPKQIDISQVIQNALSQQPGFGQDKVIGPGFPSVPDFPGPGGEVGAGGIIQLPDGRRITGHDYLNQARTMEGLQGQLGNLQGQYAGLQGQLGGLQGQYDTAQKNWNQMQSQYQGQLADAAAADQRRRMAQQFGWAGQGAGGIKHAMFMRQPGGRGWSPYSGFGREGDRISTGGLNI